MSGNSDLIDLTLQVHAKTERAILVSDTGLSADAKWIPLSQVEVEPAPGQTRSSNIVVVTMPEWLAVDRKLV